MPLAYSLVIANWGATTGGVHPCPCRPHYVDLTDTAGAWTTFLDHQHLRQGGFPYAADVTARLSVVWAQTATIGGETESIHFRLYDLDNAAVVMGPLSVASTSPITNYLFKLRTWEGATTFPGGNARFEFQYAIDTAAWYAGAPLHLSALLAEVRVWP